MRDRSSGNWLSGFMYFTSESESPNAFLLWAAYAALSGALRRRVWFTWRYTPIYPNLYIKLVGPPGTGKGQAINFTRRLLTRIKINVSAERGSTEGLINDISEKYQLQEINGLITHTSPYVVLSPDFMSFYRTSGDSIVEWLTEIFDSGDFDDRPYVYRLRNRPEEEIHKPYIVMLAGTTEAWMADTFSTSFTDQGYSARVIFVYARSPRFFKARPVITHEMWDMHERLVDDLGYITNLQGEMTATPEAWDWFEEWYNNILPKQKLDGRLQGYLGRKALHMWKVAMLTQIAESDELIIDTKMLQFALAQLENLEPMMVQAFAGVGKNPISGDYVRVFTDIVSRDRISKGELMALHSFNLRSEELDEILTSLELMHKVIKDFSNGEFYYRSSKKGPI